MTGDALNEILQWISIGILLLMTLAVYRRVGLLLVDRDEYYAASFGPRVGGLLPHRLLELISPTANSWTALLFVKDDCPICESLLERLSEGEFRANNLPLEMLIIVEGPGGAVGDLGRRLDGVRTYDASSVLDGRTRPTVYPFAILADSDGYVRLKSVGGEALDMVLEFLRAPRGIHAG